MEINVCPRWLLAKLRVPSDIRIHLGTLLSALLAISLSPVLIRVPHFCLFQKFLHAPCPGCGILHAMTALFQFDVIRAWHYNPASIAIAGVFAFQIVARPIAIASAKVRPLVGEISRWVSAASLGCLFVVWILKLVLGGFNSGFYLLS